MFLSVGLHFQSEGGSGPAVVLREANDTRRGKLRGMEGSNGGPDTSSCTGPDLVVPSRARGWEQGAGPGLVQAGFHLDVREGCQEQRCGRESGW